MTIKTRTLACFIGRFQPLHQKHCEIIKNALKSFDFLVILVGSCPKSARNIRNPFEYTDVEKMIKAYLLEENISQNRVFIHILEDKLYKENEWIDEVNDYICDAKIWFTHWNNKELGIDIEYHTYLVGSKKDETSYYLDSFPQYKSYVASVDGKKALSATEIRNDLFEDRSDAWKEKIGSSAVVKIIEEWKMDGKRRANFEYLQSEYEFCRTYKESTRFVEASYDPIFFTTDIVMIKSSYILLIERKVNPGKGLFALPGGFLGARETTVDSAIRELKEETKINLSRIEIKSNIIDSKVFDYPDRSVRGRVITNAFYVQLPDEGPFPIVKGNDDAKDAFWMPFHQMNKLNNSFFDDHWHIVDFFLNMRR